MNTQNKTLSLNFNNKPVFLDGIELDGECYFNLNDVYHASGELRDTYKPSKWRNKLSYKYRLDGKMIVLIDGKRQESTEGQNCPPVKQAHGGAINRHDIYGTQEVVIAYAARINAEFAEVVYKAFSLLVDGKTDEAALTARAVAQAFRAKTKEHQKQLTKAVNDSFDGCSYGFNKHGKPATFRTFNNLLWKAATGKPLPKPAPKHLRDELEKMGDVDALSKLDDAIVKLEALIRAGVDYQTIKQVLIGL